MDVGDHAAKAAAADRLDCRNVSLDQLAEALHHPQLFGPVAAPRGGREGDYRPGTPLQFDEVARKLPHLVILDLDQSPAAAFDLADQDLAIFGSDGLGAEHRELSTEAHRH